MNNKTLLLIVISFLFPIGFSISTMTGSKFPLIYATTILGLYLIISNIFDIFFHKFVSDKKIIGIICGLFLLFAAYSFYTNPYIVACEGRRCRYNPSATRYILK